MTHDETAASPEGYEDLARLHAAHLGMLARQSPAKGQSVLLDADEAEAFLIRAKATGAILSDPEERAIAQRIIDYWSADLLSSERSLAADVEMVTLAPYARKSNEPFFVSDNEYSAPDERSSARFQWPGVLLERPISGDVPDTSHPAPPQPEARDQNQARQYIRMASIARQWRDAHSDAYLLTGEALETARQFNRDPDIAKLVEASLEEERRVEDRRSQIKNQVIVALVVVVVALIGLSYVAWVSAQNAGVQAARAEEEKAEAAALAAEATRKSNELTRANEQLAALFASEQAQREAADTRFSELAARQRLLDVAISALVQSLVSQSASLDDIPPEIREEVLAGLAVRVQSEAIPLYDLAPDVAEALRQQMESMPFTPFELRLDGFQDGLPEPSPLATVLPGLPDNLRAAAHAEGAPVPYLHYSLVLDAQRRFALYAAANLDRLQRTVLPARPVQFELDPRLPPEVQPDPHQYPEFRSAGLEIVQLVGRNDIAWGPEGSDAVVVDRMVQVYPNTVPVLPAVHVGWEAVSHWVQTDHNPSASRIAILSGPVFPPGPSEGSLPVALWKIAVSVQDVPQKQSAGPGALIVDAFLIEDSTRGEVSDPGRHRTTVSEIARRTGLVFPPEMIAVDQGLTLLNTTEGDRLAAAVPGLDGPVAAERRVLAQQLVDAVRDDAVGTEDQAKVVSTLIESLQNVRNMSATGRLNLLLVLSQVPRSSWDRPDWLTLKAACRRAVATLEARERAGETRIGPDTRGHLNRLKTNLGLDERPRQTVYLQFDGLTRERARDMRADLAALGWNLPGEERVVTASGLKQVRYNPGNAADEAAARLLAADIAALGWTGTEAVPVRAIRHGILEIWVGDY